jgi:hypothetical protein
MCIWVAEHKWFAGEIECGSDVEISGIEYLGLGLREERGAARCRSKNLSIESLGSCHRGNCQQEQEKPHLPARTKQHQENKKQPNGTAHTISFCLAPAATASKYTGANWTRILVQRPRVRGPSVEAARINPGVNRGAAVDGFEHTTGSWIAAINSAGVIVKTNSRLATAYPRLTFVKLGALITVVTGRLIGSRSCSSARTTLTGARKLTTTSFGTCRIVWHRRTFATAVALTALEFSAHIAVITRRTCVGDKFAGVGVLITSIDGARISINAP